MSSPFSNALYYADNLTLLKDFSKKHPDGFIDLIYIDPPFNSKKNYNILYQDMIQSVANGAKTTALKEAFHDTWSNVSITDELEDLKKLDNLQVYEFIQNNRLLFSTSQVSYLTHLAIRLYYMRLLLKDTGSFYLHCDPTMSHYIKILLDMIFGEKNFINEIVWNYKGTSNSKRMFARKHDTIFLYSKTNEYTFNTDDIRLPFADLKAYKKDKEGKLYKKWSKERGDYYPPQKYENGKWQLLGKTCLDVFDDIPSMATAHGKEYLGYPTQKPEKLLERIIQASSNQGDLVADFYCGCGTSIAAAEKLNRRWLGCDISHLAISLIEQKRLPDAKYTIKGFPQDRAQAEKLAKEKHFEFEQWVVEYCLKGHQTRYTGDGGYDGHMALQFTSQTAVHLGLIEVKGGNCGIAALRSFREVINHKQAGFGIFVCFEQYITQGMQAYCDQQGHYSTTGESSVFKVPVLTVLSTEALMNKAYPDWLRHHINITYGK